MKPIVEQIRPHKWVATFDGNNGKELVNAYIIGKNPEALARKLIHAEEMYEKLRDLLEDDDEGAIDLCNAFSIRELLHKIDNG